MTFTIVRHAHAGERSTWTGDDRDRPLSERGQSEAGLVAAHVGARRQDHLLASPALRCRQTLEPLGRAQSLDVEVDDRLFEGPLESRLRDLIGEFADTDIVVCTHGDVVPVLLTLLIDDGLPAPTDLRWHKASAWTVEREDGAWTSATYWRVQG